MNAWSGGPCPAFQKTRGQGRKETLPAAFNGQQGVHGVLCCWFRWCGTPGQGGWCPSYASYTIQLYDQPIEVEKLKHARECRFSGHIVWAMTPLARIGALCLVVQRIVPAVFPLMSDALAGPLGISGPFGFRVAAGAVAAGRVAWRSWARLCHGMVAGIVRRVRHRGLVADGACP